MKEAVIIFVVFWISVLTAILCWLVWDYLKFKGTAILQNLSDKLKTDTFIVPNQGVFSLKKRRVPVVCDDMSAVRVEMEKNETEQKFQLD